MLGSLLEESAVWPPDRKSADWPTFAGDASRAKTAAAGNRFGSASTLDLSAAAAERRSRMGRRWTIARSRRCQIAAQLPSSRRRTKRHLATRCREQFTNRRARPENGAATSGRSIPANPRPVRCWTTRRDSVAPIENDAHRSLARHIGVARYTASAQGDKLFARMGSPITVPSSRRAALWLAKDQGFLLGLDLRAQGKPLEGFPIRPQSNEWTFEGTPLGDDGTIYVAMRRVEGARSQLYLAAFELPTTPVSQPDERDENARPTGRLKWRTRICSSATLGGGELDQLTHLLVTLDGDRLYLNTSAGAVAAVSADDGRLLWLVKYPRTRVRTGNPDQPERHLFRDLTPCLAWNGPGDCRPGRLRPLVCPGGSDRSARLVAAGGRCRRRGAFARRGKRHIAGERRFAVLDRRLYWPADGAVSARASWEEPNRPPHRRAGLAADCWLAITSGGRRARASSCSRHGRPRPTSAGSRNWSERSRFFRAARPAGTWSSPAAYC